MCLHALHQMLADAHYLLIAQSYAEQTRSRLLASLNWLPLQIIVHLQGFRPKLQHNMQSACRSLQSTRVCDCVRSSAA